MTVKPEIITVDLGVRRDREYLGDGAFVDHDDIQLWVSADHAGRTHDVALGPNELRNLVQYARKLGIEV